MSSVADKLKRYQKILESAGDSQALLGIALLGIHGALEDRFRDRLAMNSLLPPDSRQRVRDPGQTHWRELLDLMQQYEGLSSEDRSFIWRMNALRLKVAHGNLHTLNIAPEEVERYVKLVRSLCAEPASDRAAIAPTEPLPAHATAPIGQGVGVKTAPFSTNQPQTALIPAPATAGPTLPLESLADHLPASADQPRPAPATAATSLAARRGAARRGRRSSPSLSRGQMLIIGAIVLMIVVLLLRPGVARPTRQAGSPPPTAPTPTLGLPPLRRAAPAVALATPAQRTATVTGLGGQPLSLRPDHSLQAPPIGMLSENDRVVVVGGPVSQDGIEWWQIEAHGQQGWCAGDFLRFDEAAR